MKRFGWILLAALLLTLGCAWAEGELPGGGVDSWPGKTTWAMRVVNCEEWVSLRAEPSTSAEVLAQIPLGENLHDCRAAANGFTYCESGWHDDTKAGYILSDYLESPTFRIRVAGEPLEGTGILDEISDFSFADYEEVWELDTMLGGLEIYCAGDGWGELHMSCFDDEKGFLWGAYSDTNAFMGEDTEVIGFSGGAFEHPLAYIYNEKLGLAAISIETGAVDWTIDEGQLYLGQETCWAIGHGDGTLYLGGKDIDPIAISPEGEVLWQANAGGDPCFMSEMILTQSELIAFYTGPEGDGYIVHFDRTTGQMLSRTPTLF